MPYLWSIRLCMRWEIFPSRRESHGQFTTQVIVSVQLCLWCNRPICHSALGSFTVLYYSQFCLLRMLAFLLGILGGLVFWDLCCWLCITFIILSLQTEYLHDLRRVLWSGSQWRWSGDSPEISRGFHRRSHSQVDQTVLLSLSAVRVCFVHLLWEN